MIDSAHQYRYNFLLMEYMFSEYSEMEVNERR